MYCFAAKAVDKGARWLLQDGYRRLPVREAAVAAMQKWPLLGQVV
jgi:hypothetical protein